MTWPDEPFLNLRQIATPAGNPSSGGNLLYFKADGNLYKKNSAGTETAFGSGDVTLNGVQTLTNKDLTSATNTFPSSLVTLTGVQTLTNKTLTSPRIGGGILDVNGVTLLGTQAVVGAVNNLKVVNNGAGIAPQLLAEGTDTDISINLVPKGLGTLKAGGVSVATISGTQTLTNKDLSSSTNIFPAAPDVQVFTAGGTWTKPAGAKTVVIECVGGGGAGGGAALAAAGQHSCGSGGGAGGYGWKQVAAGSLGATETVTVGAAGTGVSGAAGNAGGTTSLGTQVSVGGGGGGATQASTAVDFGTAGGTGGTATTGTVLVPGDPGDLCQGNGTLGVSGKGGSGKYGAGGKAVVSGAVAQTLVGTAATGFGGGGSGALSTAGGAANTGGAGTAGLVIVTTYFM